MIMRNHSFDEGLLRNALRSRERRTIIEQVEKADTPIERSQLAHAIDPTQPHEAEIDVYHCHLPKLASAGIVDWDQTTGEITAGENFELALELKE